MDVRDEPVLFAPIFRICESIPLLVYHLRTIYFIRLFFLYYLQKISGIIFPDLISFFIILIWSHSILNHVYVNQKAEVLPPNLKTRDTPNQTFVDNLHCSYPITEDVFRVLCQKKISIQVKLVSFNVGLSIIIINLE